MLKSHQNPVNSHVERDAVPRDLGDQHTLGSVESGKDSHLIFANILDPLAQPFSIAGREKSL